MATKKSFWVTLPGILTGIAAVITALTGLLLALNNFECPNGGEPPPPPPPAIEEHLQGLLETNQQGWNENDIGRIMGPWHHNAEIVTPDGKIHKRQEYEEIIRPVLQNWEIRYGECTNFREEGNHAFLECFAEVSRRKNPESDWKVSSRVIHFEFIEENGDWFIWRQEFH